MKFLIVLCCAALALAGDYEDMWKQALQKINNHPRSTWKAGIYSHWKGKNNDFFKSLAGTLLDRDVDPEMVRKAPMVKSMPASFDSAHKWNCQSISTIRDQANCGSCWAVSGAEVASDRTCISTGKQVYLSEDPLMSCCSYCGNGCQGGYPIDAQAYFHKSGLVTGGPWGSNQGCQPYTVEPCNKHQCNGEVSTPPCSGSCQASYQTSYNSDKHFGDEYYYVGSSETALQYEIYTNGPIQCAFTVYSDFYSYKSGVYQHLSGKQVGGHAIRVVGWGSENGIKYWKVANSWGTLWGEQGYFRIRRGVNECGIEAKCVASYIYVWKRSQEI